MLFPSWLITVLLLLLLLFLTERTVRKALSLHQAEKRYLAQQQEADAGSPRGATPAGTAGKGKPPVARQGHAGREAASSAGSGAAHANGGDGHRALRDGAACEEGEGHAAGRAADAELGWAGATGADQHIHEKGSEAIGMGRDGTAAEGSGLQRGVSNLSAFDGMTAASPRLSSCLEGAGANWGPPRSSQHPCLPCKSPCRTKL